MSTVCVRKYFVIEGVSMIEILVVWCCDCCQVFMPHLGYRHQGIGQISLLAGCCEHE